MTGGPDSLALSSALRPARRPASTEAPIFAALVAGTAASVLSSMALLICGRLDGRSAAAPTNATSHWLWGPRALAATAVSVRYTLVGYAIHHAMSIFWALVHRRIRRPRPPPLPLARDLAESAGTAALAFVVDYTITPRRLRPGFEHHLSARSMFIVYAAFALGLALASRATDGRAGKEAP